MKEKWCPKYFCVDTRAAKLVMRLPGESRLEFYDGLFSAFLRAVDDTEIPEPSDDFTGDLLRQAIDTMIDCFEVYRKRAFANPGGGKKDNRPPGEQSPGNGDPMGTQSPGSEQQEISSSGNDISKHDNIIISRLKAEGYSDDEIMHALSRAEGRSGIRDLFSYLRKTIEEARKNRSQLPTKTVTAQQYTQRDYGGEDEAAMKRMLEYGGIGRDAV